MKRRSLLFGSIAAAVAAPIVSSEAKLSFVYDEIHEIKSFVIGRAYNISPTKVDLLGFIYRFTHEPGDVELLEVYVGGEPLKYFGDGERSDEFSTPTYSFLHPPPGHYSTCRELGMFVVNEPPTKPLLVDLRGKGDI